MLRRALAALALALAPLAVVTPTAGAATAPAVAFPDSSGIHVVSVTHPDDRLWKLVVSTPALAQQVRVNVLLPTGYASSTKRFPVLYLFHGTSGGADDWLTAGSAEQTTAGLPMIVVMPDAGYHSNGGSWFTNWVDQTTSLGTANWETFHIDQLVPFVDHDLRTVTTRGGRAIAGLSQGGFGSFSYASRHPDLFGAAASFSGAPDITSDPVVTSGATGVVTATETLLDQVPPGTFFGDRVTDAINWQGHDPAVLVGNLAHTDLRLWVGNGQPGPYDSVATYPQGYLGGASIEELVHTSTTDWAAIATAAHIPYVLDDYGPGTHSWPYWTRDLQEWVGPLMADFAHLAAAPTTVGYTSVDATWSQWGWTVANHRTAAQAFSTLTAAGPGGFALTGPGSATVTTPPAYAPRSTHQVVLRLPSGDSRLVRVVADAAGRLTVAVPLGGSTTTVRIR